MLGTVTNLFLHLKKICHLNIKLNIINSKSFLLFTTNSAVVFSYSSGYISVTIHN